MAIPRIEVSLVAEDCNSEYVTINKPKAAAEEVTKLIGHKDREYFLCLHVNSKNQAISHEIISIGSLASSLVHPREVFKSAISANSAAIIIAHNHPSGDTKSSKEDDNVTIRISKAGKLLGIPVLDHIIVTQSGSYYSYAENNMLSK